MCMPFYGSVAAANTAKKQAEAMKKIARINAGLPPEEEKSKDVFIPYWRTWKIPNISYGWWIFLIVLIILFINRGF